MSVAVFMSLPAPCSELFETFPAVIELTLDLTEVAQVSIAVHTPFAQSAVVVGAGLFFEPHPAARSARARMSARGSRRCTQRP